MKIVIATPLFPPDIGGPAKYAESLAQEFTRRGAVVRVITYGALERSLPAGVRHAAYFCRVLPHVLGARFVLGFDTWSTGLPALLAAHLLGRPFLVRIGGDMVWESYIDRTGESVKLSAFYRAPRRLSLKERLIKWGTGVVAAHADALIFNTQWLLDISREGYGFVPERALVIENEYEPRTMEVPQLPEPVFVAATRQTSFKNQARLEQVAAAVKARHPAVLFDTRPLPREEHLARVARAYAVIVPSLSEVNSNTIIEGLSLGKPFIAPRDCGFRQRLEGCGLFTDTADPAAFAAAIEELLKPEVYRARRAAISRFTFVHSWQDIADEIFAAAGVVL